VEAYLQCQNIKVIAGVRDPSAETSKTLSSLPTHQTSTLIITALESGSEASAKSAIEAPKTTHHITHLDIVIANAGIGNYWAPASSANISELQNHFLINTIGPLILFQATLPLLKASPNPRFIPITSILGSIIYIDNAPLPSSVYGSSKAALNFLTKKIHQENTEVTAFVVHPGWIDTEVGNAGAEAAGLEKAPDSLDGSNIESLVALVSQNGTSNMGESANRGYSLEVPLVRSLLGISSTMMGRSFRGSSVASCNGHDLWYCYFRYLLSRFLYY
jgi:norsolorinic acid ketoreductase